MQLLLLCRSAAPALLLKGLLAVLPLQLREQLAAAAAGSPGAGLAAQLLPELLAAEASAAGAAAVVPKGSQDLPVDTSNAPPLFWPAEKVCVCAHAMTARCLRGTILHPCHVRAEPGPPWSAPGLSAVRTHLLLACPPGCSAAAGIWGVRIC